MSLQEKIVADATAAAKGADELRRDTLRLLLAALHNREIEKKGKPARPSDPSEQHSRASIGHSGGGEATRLTDEETVTVLEREARKRKEAAEFFERGNRPELAAKERTELTLIETYLPAALPEEKMDELIDEALRVSGAVGAKEVGKAIAVFRRLAEEAAKGARVDAALAAEKIKKRLVG